MSGAKARRAEDKLASMSGVERAVYEAVPCRSAWGIGQVVNELRRAGRTASEPQVRRCLLQLEGAGLVSRAGGTVGAPQFSKPAPARRSKRPATKNESPEETMATPRTNGASEQAPPASPAKAEQGIEAMALALAEMADEIRTAMELLTDAAVALAQAASDQARRQSKADKLLAALRELNDD